MEPQTNTEPAIEQLDHTALLVEATVLADEQIDTQGTNREGAAVDVGSLALEQTTETPDGMLSPNRFRLARRILAKALVVTEVMRISPPAIVEDMKSVFTDNHALNQGMSTQQAAAIDSPKAIIRS